MRIPDLSVSNFLTVIRRLQGRGGWTNEDGSVRVRELEAIATAASDGAQLIRDAGLAAFPTRDVNGAGTAEWEELLRVVNDYPLATDEERRARIAAYRREVNHNSAAAVLETVKAMSGITLSSIATPKAAGMTDRSCEPEAIFATRAVVSDAGDLGKLGRLRAAARALMRVSPARLLSRHPLETFMREMTDGSVVTWAPSGSLATGRMGNATVTSYPFAPARVVSFPPNGKLTPEDLQAIQREILWRGGRPNGTGVSRSGILRRLVVVDLSIAKDLVIDTSVDWRERYVQISLRAGSVDFRPGEASDTAFKNQVPQNCFGHTRAGGVTSEILDESISFGAVVFYVDLDGALCVKTDEVGAYFAVAMIEATGQVDGASDDVEYIDEPESMWLEFWLESHYKLCNELPSWSGDPGSGGVHRVGFLVNSERPPTPTGVTTYTLDASVDWRDRLLSVQLVSREGAYGVVPGANDGNLRSYAPINLIYTGPGAAEGAGDSFETWQFPLFAGLALYADSETGHLMAQRKGDFIPSAPFTVGLVIHGSQQTGQRSTPPAALAVPVLGAEGAIVPADLHYLQDCAVLQQCQGSRSRLLAEAIAKKYPAHSDTFPLGPVRAGRPALPVEWFVRNRFGERRDLERARLLQRRQVLRGAIKIPIAFEAPSGLTVIDATTDWRDRIIITSCRIRTVDIRPGGAESEDVNGGGLLSHTRAFYSGPGDDGVSFDYASQLVEFDPFDPIDVLMLVTRDGELAVFNGEASTYYGVAMVEATPRLGPRSYAA